MESYFVGVDVGTGSVRAALVTGNGKLLHTSSKNTKTWSPEVGYFEQSTDDIWRAVCYVVKVKQFFYHIFLRAG
jgi:ribulose kinase